jgi:hypothetical protein
MAGFVPAAPGTAKSQKPYRDLAEKRHDRTVPVVLHRATAATAPAIRPPNDVAPDVCGNGLLLEAGRQQLPLGQGQSQISDIAAIIQAVDLHNVDAVLFRVIPGFHERHIPSHVPTLAQ